MLVHLSNQHFDLEPMLARQVEAGKLAGLVQHDRDMSAEEYRRGKMSSSWAILARTADDLGELRRDPRWKTLKAPPGAPLWTDRYSNLLSVLR